METYYRKRAPVYDRVYAYPERQKDLRYLEQFVTSKFVGRDVLEVAAGTGYWTQFIASQASSVLATDATKEALVQVKQRPNTECVSTEVIDAYELFTLDHLFEAAFAGLWISHVPKQNLALFIKSLCECLVKGSTVVFIDNSIAQCARLPISHCDDLGNTYQNRKLDDGSHHRVLKNFPTEQELLQSINGAGHKQHFQELENFWTFEFETT